MIRFELDPERTPLRVLGALVCVELAIVLADIWLNHFAWIPDVGLRRSFNITREDGLGNWMSSSLFLATAALLAGIAAVEKRRDDDSGLSGHRGWLLLAGLFLYLAVDDATMLHERIGDASEDAVEGWIGIPSYAWQVVVGPFLVAGVAGGTLFLWRRASSFPALRRGWCLGVGCYVAAVALDFLEGLDAAAPLHADLRHGLMVVEELLEMLGTSFVLYGLLAYALASAPRLVIESGGSTP